MEINISVESSNMKTVYTVEEYLKKYYNTRYKIKELLPGLQTLLKNEYPDKWKPDKTYDTKTTSGYLPVPFYLRLLLTYINMSEEEIDIMSYEEQITYLYLFT